MAAQPEPYAENDIAAAATTAKQPVVLVVDDNPTNLSVLFDLLNDAGFKMLVATDGEGAIAQLEYVTPDLILLDVMMPGIDGFETCQRLKANSVTAEIPVIFMTALSDTVDKVHGFDVGAVDYITKPIEHEEVLARLHTHLTIKALQHRLQDQNAALQQEISDRQQAEESLRIFLHAVSHDLRNPVTGMLMLLQNLLDKNPDQDKTIAIPRRVLERMCSSSDRQLNLINSLLESYANDIKGLKLYCESVHLANLVEGIINDLESIAVAEKASLANQIDVNLQPVYGDVTQLGRVFQNLISNALKHNPPGLKLVIKAQVFEPGSDWPQEHSLTLPQPSAMNLANTPLVVCSIEDDGVGMSSHQCESLFDLYARGDGKRAFGLGLGLYICRQIILAHGGEIGVVSQPDVGSRFWFTLPIAS
ncbi:response regulator receiver sensor signal transduction histidine kinase [Thalassoporum mexicanum PCC 7367]|uniref:hybrid sensor histidine kinase/response regulator n=1 Tax=Thalassoporum mexicanum TaxID=3457544 RepID=UPI00029FB1CC|nr:hybrid sensor histidine kinase/response regulator [Pseudanabaena sp. PCC 7367]AFY70507.1 response regulator receiver sensor signal transduction histidine kinase [Pseudanabaena sp. PCC 7367]